MFYAFGFERIGIVLSDLYFVDPDPKPGQEGPERGARLEVRLFERPEPDGSIYAARPVEIGQPLWRADLLETVAGPPGTFDRTHHHPRFRGWEPGSRVFDEELSGDPIGWVAEHLADVDAMLEGAGVTDVDIPPAEREALRGAIPEITAALRRILEGVHSGKLAQAPAGGPVAAARTGWL